MGLFKTSPFPSKGTYGPSSNTTSSHLITISARYRRLLKTHPALAFGLPFVGTVVAGSFFLTPATAIRYERFDRKTHMLDRSEAMGMGFKNLGQKKDAGNAGNAPTDPATKEQTKEERRKAGGRFKSRDIREEYYKLAGNSQKLDDWEPVRVKRLPGEPDGTFDDS